MSGTSDIDRPSSPDSGRAATPTLTITGIAAGGAGIARGEDGRVVFVRRGLPGEVVRVRVERSTRQFSEATVVEVIEPVDGRVEPPCPGVARGCGGCDWQHATPGLQSELRRATVVDALRRIAKLDPVRPDGPPVLIGPSLPAQGYRTILRAAVSDGRAGFRRERAHEVVTAERCLIAHPLAQELLSEARFPGAHEVRIVIGARTGERLVVVSGDGEAAQRAQVPGDVRVVASGHDHDRSGGPAFVHEEVGGSRLRISAGSFFQCRPDGAEALVDLVAAGLGNGGGTLLDAYAGVGLFSVLLGVAGSGSERAVVAIESNPSSVADALVNLPPSADVVASRVEDWQPRPVDLAVADPSRRGLGATGADRLAATGVGRLVLVSCDPASLARDARLLTDRGFVLEQVTVVDLFGHTSHVEAVSVFSR